MKLRMNIGEAAGVSAKMIRHYEEIGLWGNTRRASREVKALAAQHLAELEEKMREMAQMQQALQRVVASCHGDDDPHCAILDELAIDSPSLPDHDARPKAPARGKAGSHVDLMAWTRSVRAS